jgi:hypothetical protein
MLVKKELSTVLIMLLIRALTKSRGVSTSGLCFFTRYPGLYNQPFLKHLPVLILLTAYYTYEQGYSGMM